MAGRSSKNPFTKALSFLLVALTSASMVQAAGKPVRKKPAKNTETACKAENYAYLIGQKGSVLDQITLPENTRILRPGMIITMDYSEWRLNIYINKAEEIEKVSCG
jgi:peptidase inhibitor I78 family protein